MSKKQIAKLERELKELKRLEALKPRIIYVNLFDNSVLDAIRNGDYYDTVSDAVYEIGVSDSSELNTYLQKVEVKIKPLTKSELKTAHAIIDERED